MNVNQLSIFTSLTATILVVIGLGLQYIETIDLELFKYFMACSNCCTLVFLSVYIRPVHENVITF